MSIGNRPTGIQRVALPALIAGDDSRDALVHAQTGSGKTLAYLLPIIQSLLPLCTETWIDRSVGTLAIILAPTRELARQIYEVAEKLCQLHLSTREDNSEGQEQQSLDDTTSAPLRRTRWLVPGLLSGGSTKNHEKSRLRKGIPILVATPGRLLDHLQNTSSFEVGKCRWLVLDEADRLLEMGFRETLEGILKAMDGRRRLAYGTAREAMQDTWGESAEITPQDVEDGTGTKWWATPRKTVLCSATLDENVQTLAGTYLRKPQVLRGGSDLAPSSPIRASSASHNPAEADENADTVTTEEAKEALQPEASTQSLYPRLAAPAQLRQNAVIVAPKLRLVTLIALLRSALARNSTNTDAKRVIVFVSCTDSVEFLWNALGGVKMGEPEGTSDAAPEEADAEPETSQVSKACELFPDAPVYRLHGSLAQSDRIASLKGFSTSVDGSRKQKRSTDGAILLCTSVAARGLDLPSVGCVIQLDSPTEGGVDEYLHRIGRTARVGKDGESWILFLPHEKEARNRLENAMQRNKEELQSAGSSATTAASSSVIAEVSADLVLKRGFGGRGDEYESRATDVQLAFERWVLKRSGAVSLARRAFLSHIRAYATHPTNEKDLFHVRFLHLGHLAKSFALREAPDAIKENASKDVGSLSATKKAARGREKKAGVAVEPHRKSQKPVNGEAIAAGASAATANGRTNIADDGEDDEDQLESTVPNRRKQDIELAKLIANARRSQGGDILQDVSRQSRKGGKGDDAEARMYAKVRQLGRHTKVGGNLGAYGADEFQIA